MTAVVGILNKQAVAIAADSAVTIGDSDNHKIFNKANKVFTLSKYHPVGVMIYNSASFMSTPWETIIKVYREQLNEKCFPTIKDYQVDFIEFLRLKDFYTDEDTQKLFLENLSLNVINSFIREIGQEESSLFESLTQENIKRFLELFEIKIDSFNLSMASSMDYCPEFVDYTFEMFDRYSSQTIEQIIQIHFVQHGIAFTPELLNKIKNVIWEVLRKKESVTSYTGLIFTGFGENEIYPQLVPINISMVINGRLRYYVDKNSEVSISNTMEAAVRPFAQTDVIDTILRGIDPNLDEIYLMNFKKILQKYNDAILESIGDTNPVLSQQISELDNSLIISELEELNLQIKRENYIHPLMNAVSSLSKEDLAEMAESLIYLTYLKRRITFAEESVGGPVDVAVISKGDGFVWIKRKHYFRPELNQHFFNNYFKK